MSVQVAVKLTRRQASALLRAELSVGWGVMRSADLTEAERRLKAAVQKALTAAATPDQNDPPKEKAMTSSYTEDDVRLVGDAIGDRSIARAALGVLAEAGRLPAPELRRELAKEFEARAELAESATGLDQAAFVWRQAARIARGETVEATP